MDEVIPIPSNMAAPLVNAADYRRMYEESVRDPDTFWGELAEDFVWRKKWSKVKNTRFDGDVSIRWFEGGKLNLTESCIDRHTAAMPDKTAIIWEGNTPGQVKRISFRQLKDEVCRVANALKSLGVKKGDRVSIYMPMVPETAYAMLACARIGAVHSVIFGGFSADSIRGRMEDCGSDFLITADEGRRGEKTIPLKATVDKAIEGLKVRHVLVLAVTGAKVAMQSLRDVSWESVVPKQSTECEPEVMDAEDPLFILYTSGSTGKPKGVLHTTAGYLIYAAVTHRYAFDIRGNDVFWCTADVGWVTGHSYILYGPLANGCTTLMFEGVPNYPDNSRFWDVVDAHKVTKFYTAPTAIRALMRLGDEPVTKTSRASLQILGSVGEPINPEAWLWYYRVVGEERCPVVDTWWQTETGGHMITPLPGAMEQKPGSCALPFFGVQPRLTDNKGNVVEGPGEGQLVITDSWPGQARSLYGDHARFIQTYFSQVPGAYFTGDGARRDADGYYWITGRVDDVINVSGHRLGTAEIESALVAHKHVAEAAVVGFAHDIKGQGIYAYVTLREGIHHTAELAKELRDWVREQIGPIATPDFVHLTPALPKTRSGKIMRRILRKIASNEVDSLGDTTTLLNPETVDALIESRLNR